MADHMEQAAQRLAAADGLEERITTAKAAGEHGTAGSLLARQRVYVKRAEVHALLAIADELARIGLSR